MNLKLKLIIGLGNPDPKYQNTYHNVGHLFIDYLTKSSQLKTKNLKTDVYMNESGRFVARTLKKHNANPKELLIVHDDSDLGLGTYKLQFGRGAAGHHGIENVIKVLKTKNFWRLRIGIRPPQEKTRQRAEKFVLKKISTADKKSLEGVFEKL
ncbi:MAG: hypothetical protein A2745_02625 [Candidatus Harrisonbacteria bacterium RIFCSPHIGHO2_01_FULL_44_13]|uniref:Aminoacyl-tRNA hydrolase n=1 Tax=Candidatus Harrisonbacteria bacterium RIFCSPLOWO2_01_FULL_44_18 TaxID=1798407 RepID=A0A1G1ZQ40_9BACT|nr:MAG: hypothetical protein A2745_02625 [Candidatus Harrisonbacteria bacterium RIFCSPHIGHO2_01_FULL_44_13]OGY66296.1 MAG: hypothetical protein A3A16_00085 [Candidatus Harrisonbacteria bacterium RIFCSPLOWO2_01_FULL_44_18]